MSVPTLPDCSLQDQHGLGHHLPVRQFNFSIYTWGPAGSCESGAEEQTADHTVLECPKHSPPNGAYSLAVLDDETIN